MCVYAAKNNYFRVLKLHESYDWNQLWCQLEISLILENIQRVLRQKNVLFFFFIQLILLQKVNSYENIP